MGTSRSVDGEPFRETDAQDPQLPSQQSPLTPEEFQSAVRGPQKSVGSMNMDEFLTNIWSTEEGSEQAPQQQPVAEVWSNMQWQPPEVPGPGMSDSQRQPTLGEMTLEDFLVKAGVVREGVRGHLLTPSSAIPVKQNLPLQPQGYGWAAKTGNGPARIELPESPDSSESLDRPSWMRKRDLDGPVEKVVERRQRRMMKNRESAARSRARKQAYTVELEKELSFLKEENARLKDEQRKSAERRRQTMVDSMTEQAKANLRKEAKSGRPDIRLCRSCRW